MSFNSSRIGSAAEFAVAVSAMEYGFMVSQPLGCYAHYDLIMDVNNTLIKVQVKSLHKNGGGLRCPCTRTIRNRNRYETIRYSNHDFDFAAGYFKETKEVFIVPFEIFTSAKQSYCLSQKQQSVYKNAWHLLEEFASNAQRFEQSAFNPNF